MRTQIFAFLVFSTTISVASAQPPAELLVSIGRGQSRRLENYNSTFLLKELYAAARYRIVSVNTELLLNDGPITITPFDDVDPITIAPEAINRSEDLLTWRGRVDVDRANNPYGVNYFAILSVHWWDINPSGVAEMSASNRFKFSSDWTIDVNDRPVLPPRGQEGISREIGPPPESPEEIAEHKRLLQLDRFAFASLRTRIELPSGRTFVVSPLRFTPRYSVVYEINQDNVIEKPFEPEDAARLTDESRARLEAHEAFIRSMPDESGRAILGDVR